MYVLYICEYVIMIMITNGQVILKRQDLQRSGHQ